LNHDVLRRAFGILGPVEATVAMTAFIVTLLTLGWSPGSEEPEQATVYAASGAAFAAVVIGQIANAFACRSTTQWPGALGPTTNKLLLIAVAFQASALVAFIFVSPLNSLLEQDPPTAIGWVIALLAAPAVIAADAGHKLWRRHRSPRGL
jgi:magnesium-transporting ATPase (P-type)